MSYLGSLTVGLTDSPAQHALRQTGWDAYLDLAALHDSTDAQMTILQSALYSVPV